MKSLTETEVRTIAELIAGLHGQILSTISISICGLIVYNQYK